MIVLGRRPRLDVRAAALEKQDGQARIFGFKQAAHRAGVFRRNLDIIGSQRGWMTGIVVDQALELTVAVGACHKDQVGIDGVDAVVGTPGNRSFRQGIAPADAKARLAAAKGDPAVGKPGQGFLRHVHKSLANPLGKGDCSLAVPGKAVIVTGAGRRSVQGDGAVGVRVAENHPVQAALCPQGRANFLCKGAVGVEHVQ